MCLRKRYAKFNLSMCVQLIITKDMWKCVCVMRTFSWNVRKSFFFCLRTATTRKTKKKKICCSPHQFVCGKKKIHLISIEQKLISVRYVSAEIDNVIPFVQYATTTTTTESIPMDFNQQKETNVHVLSQVPEHIHLGVESFYANFFHLIRMNCAHTSRHTVY